MTIRGAARADVKHSGGITLPAGKLYEIARSLPDSEVRFKSTERGQVAITCGRVRYKIAGQPREEFPKLPDVDASKGMRLPADVLRGMVERVSFALDVGILVDTVRVVLQREGISHGGESTMPCFRGET